MNNRSITTIVLTVVLVCLVMAVSVFFSLNGSASAEKYSSDSLWSKSYSGAESMKIIDLTGDGVNDLFIQSGSDVTYYDGAGNQIAFFDIGFGKSTMGDVNADGVEDVALFQVFPPMVQLVSKGEATTLVDTTTNIGSPSRVAVIKFPGQTQIILGDESGGLLALDAQGNELWRSTMGFEELRGMDDARVNGQIYLAVGSHSGDFGVVDASGSNLWKNSTEQLRRMRSYDLFGDGTSEVLTGGEYGEFAIWNAADGSQLFSKSMGQPVSEIRTAEIDGDPSSIEIIVGGKDGGLWAFTASGKQLWSATLADKITEIVGADFTGDGVQEVIVGDDAGEVAIFSGKGARSSLKNYNTGITRIDEGKLNGERVVAVSSMTELETLKVEHNAIPGFQFTPILVGLIVSAALIAVAWILATLPAKPELKVNIQDKSRESLEAERRMIKESIADVERLRKSGEVVGDAYLARLKRLRGDLAENETAFKEQGFPIRVETITCPNCGGTLELGMDKCEY
ncbi:MAG: PQQ-binding-like beta-propeller repeat protein, partial [Chloroflexota bacterium]